MATPDLPTGVIQMLASRAMRTHHARWHYVRDNWQAMSPQERAFYTQIGWQPPRLAGQPDAGLDFLFMHRQMIRRVNDLLETIGDPDYPRVEGWSPIPWDHNDPDWPMPPIYDPDVAWAKRQALTDFFQSEVANKFENAAWLLSVALDAFATEMEAGIHNWLHMHWSDAPWYTGALGQDPDDPRNDYLGSTYSSHVNKAFWKLHGWIDDRITQWEEASGQLADFSQSWEGPPHDHDHPHPFELHAAAAPAETMPLPPLVPLTRAEAEHAATKFRKPVTR